MEVGVRFGRRVWVVVLAAAVLGISGAAYAGGGWLGVMLQPLSDEIGEAMNLEKGATGVLVSDVVDGSPADVAGVEKGDVIVEIDGASIADVDGAVAKVKSLDPGSTVKMVVVRDGKKQVLTAELGERAAMPKMESDYDDEGEDDEDFYSLRIPRVKRIMRDLDVKGLDFGQGGYIGVEIRDISADLGSYFGVGCCEGVLVLDVVEDSPAAKAGLKAGDVIIKADGEAVRSSGEFAAFVRDHEPGDKLDVTFKRSKETRRVVVEVGENDCSKIFLNWKGEPDVFRMGGRHGDLREKCLALGEKCRMLGEECAERCRMMGMGPGKCCMMMGKGGREKDITCRVKLDEGPDKDVRVMVMERPGKAMEAHEKAMKCHGKAMEAEGQEMMKCHRMMEGRGPGEMPEEMKVMMMGRGEGPRAELEAEIEALKKELEHLKQEMEARR